MSISPWHSATLDEALCLALYGTTTVGETPGTGNPTAAADHLHRSNDSVSLPLCELAVTHLLSWFWQDQRALTASLLQDTARPSLGWNDVAVVTGMANADAARRTVRNTVDANHQFIATSRPRLHEMKPLVPSDDPENPMQGPQEVLSERVRRTQEALRAADPGPVSGS